MTYIGKSLPRFDALSKVTGKAMYPGDYNLPDQGYMKVLFADRPHALVKSIDTRGAESLEGVLAVYTSKDVPNNEYGLIIPDQPVLCGPGSNNPAADRVRFIGDQIAVVVAESEEIAKNAVEKIVVEYENLPIVTNPIEAMQADAVLLQPQTGSNIFCTYTIDKGDAEKELLNSSVIVEGTYQTPAQEHAYLQPEAGISYIDEAGRITVVVGGQWAHEDQEQIAHALALPLDKVRVIYPSIGGAFGGREDMSVQIILALATWKLHLRGIDRPIKIVWSREESIIGHHKRHPYYIKSRWGANLDGKVIAADIQLIADGGAYAYTSTKVLGNAIFLANGPYEIPNVKIEAFAVYTNNIPNGAFRGFGGPQSNFAAECQMNKLAEKLGMDPVELRKINMIDDHSFSAFGTPYPKGVSIKEVVEDCAQATGWTNRKEHKTRKQNPDTRVTRGSFARGIGFACGYKNVGFSYGAPEQCQATIELSGNNNIEHAELRHAGAEVGQGVHTIMLQIAAESLGIKPDQIELISSDTANTGNSGSVSASRMTFMAGNAIIGAAKNAKKLWDEGVRPAKAFYQYRPPATTAYSPEYGKTNPNFSYGYVAESIEVEVDHETGQIRILKVVCSNDVGQAINPKLVEGQIEGAVVQAAGYSLLENFVQKDGVPITKTLSTYLIPTVLDIPDQVESRILQFQDPIGPYGARGMGEMPYLPFPAAVIAAVQDATGVWFDYFPLTPEVVLKGMGKI